MSVENISLFNSVLDEALERLGKKNLKLKECQYEAVKAVVVDRKDTICILLTGYGKSLIYQLLPFVLLNYLFPTHARMGDIQFFVCRSRIIPEPPFPSQGIAGSGNEIGLSKAKARGEQHTIRGLGTKLRRDWEHENESKNFGIFKEISGFLGSLLGICTKLQLAS